MKNAKNATIAQLRYAADRDRGAAHGEAGYERARLITWDGVVERLLAE